MHTNRTGAPPSRAAVLTVGTFAVGTDAFVVAGVLPDLARSLHVGVAQAAQLVTVFALAYAVLAPVLAALTGRWARRTLLLTALLVFVLGNVATALAPSYALVVAARVLAAAGAAMFTPNASASAAALAPPGQQARAISSGGLRAHVLHRARRAAGHLPRLRPELAGDDVVRRRAGSSRRAGDRPLAAGRARTARGLLANACPRSATGSWCGA